MSLVRWYLAISTTWWLPCFKASAPSFCQFSFVSRARAACSATSMLPQSTARLKRVCSSATKCSATCGKPFFWR